MTGAQGLAAAISELLPTGLTWHVGQAPTGTVAPPWGIQSHHLPAVVERGASSVALSRLGEVRLTVATPHEQSSRAWLERAVDALEGARITAPGWRTSPLRQVGTIRVYPDRDATLTATNSHLIVGAVAFEYTAIPTA